MAKLLRGHREVTHCSPEPLKPQQMVYVPVMATKDALYQGCMIMDIISDVAMWTFADKHSRKCTQNKMQPNRMYLWIISVKVGGAAKGCANNVVVQYLLFGIHNISILRKATVFWWPFSSLFSPSLISVKFPIIAPHCLWVVLSCWWNFVLRERQQTPLPNNIFFYIQS